VWFTTSAQHSLTFLTPAVAWERLINEDDRGLVVGYRHATCCFPPP
jgi:hypothetical protein